MGPTWNGTGMKWDQHEMGQTWNGPLWHELGQTDMKWDQHEMGRAWNGTLGHEMGLTWNGTDMKWPDMIWPTWFGPTWNGRAWNGIYPVLALAKCDRRQPSVKLKYETFSTDPSRAYLVFWTLLCWISILCLTCLCFLHKIFNCSLGFFLSVYISTAALLTTCKVNIKK